jgi:hypothetical protein
MVDPCYRTGPRLLGMSSLPGLTRQAMLPKGTRMLRTGRFRHCIMDHRVKPGGNEVNTRPATQHSGATRPRPPDYR